MLSDSQVIERVRRGNPVEDLADLPDPRFTAIELLGLRGREEPAMTDTEIRTQPEAPQTSRWRGPAFAAAAMVVVLLAVGVAALVGGRSTDEPMASSFTCPPGSTPDVAGPGNGARPKGTPNVNQRAVFDERAGRIVYVDGEGATWTFDVCSNTWEQAHPALARFEGYAAGDLVYDVDSDLTLAFDSDGGIDVFDADLGTWTTRYSPSWLVERGAIYDPITGLVVVAHLKEGPGWGVDAPDQIFFSGYDVETGTWSELAAIDNVWGTAWMFLVGYSSETDELILHGGYAPETGDPLDTEPSAAGPTTILHGLRTEATTVISGGPNLFAPWGTWYPYAIGVDGAVMPSSDSTEVKRRLCRFDAPAQAWDDCSLDPFDGPRRSSDTMVYDPVNDRLVMIYAFGDVWAVDLESAEWVQLLDARRDG